MENPRINITLNQVAPAWHSIPQRFREAYSNSVYRRNVRSRIDNGIYHSPPSYTNEQILWERYIKSYFNTEPSLNCPQFIEDIPFILKEHNFLFNYRNNNNTNNKFDIFNLLTLANINLVISLRNFIYGTKILKKIDQVMILNNNDDLVAIENQQFNLRMNNIPSISNERHRTILTIDIFLYERIREECENTESMAYLFHRMCDIIHHNILIRPQDNSILSTNRSKYHYDLKKDIVKILTEKKLSDEATHIIYDLILQSNSETSSIL